METEMIPPLLLRENTFQAYVIFFGLTTYLVPILYAIFQFGP